MADLLFNMSENFVLEKQFITEANLTLGEFQYRAFPDGEDYLRIMTDVSNKRIFLLVDLHNPNNKILTIIFIAATLRTQGAKKIHLIAPYLPYLRQDKIFKPGEALTSQYFAQLISNYFDSLITIEPHLHRYQSLNEIYSLE